MATFAPSRGSTDTAPSTPISLSGQSTPDRTSSPSIWSTPGSLYFDSPTSRKSSIGSSATTGDSTGASDTSPVLRQGSGWRIDDFSPCPRSVAFPLLNTTNAQKAVQENIQGFRHIDRFENLILGKKIAEGQWSSVYMATFGHAEQYPTQQTTSTAHHLPVATSQSYTGTQSTCPPSSMTKPLLAAKVGSGKSSVKVLRNEARFLRFLMERPWSRNFVVDFLGYDLDRNMLVMENIPVTLEAHVAAMEAVSVVERSRRVAAELVPISRQLINGLHFLHQEKVIHGDIKPANVLVRRTRKCDNMSTLCPSSLHISSVEPATTEGDTSNEPGLGRADLEAVYCDFSASRFDEPDSIPTQSAGTYDYMAPELFSRKTPDNFPTASSDVYALGVTLLYVISGRSPYAHATNVFMRRAMAMQGKAMEFVMTDITSHSRVLEARFQPYVERAIQAVASERWSAAQWKRWLDSGV